MVWCDSSMIDEEVFGEVVDERGRRLAGLAVRQVAGVVLDAAAEAHLLHHLEVVEGPLLEPLLLDEFDLVVEDIEPLAKLLPDARDGLAHLLLRRDVVRSGVDAVALERPLGLAAQGVDLADGLDDVAEELDAHGGVLLVGGEHLDHVAAHAERAAVKVDVVSLVLDVDEHPEQVVAPELLADLRDR